MKKKMMTILAFVLLNNCGTFFGTGENNSKGNETLSFDNPLITFNASTGLESYYKLPLTNPFQEIIHVKNFAFTNNPCTAFSIFSITATDGTVLHTGGANAAIDLETDETLYFNIRFSASNCTTSDYETIFLVTYSMGDSTTNTQLSVRLHSQGKPVNTSNPTPVCDNEDTSVEYTRWLEPLAIPEPGTYFLKIERMRGYIYPDGAPDFVTLIGTDLGGLAPGAFKSPYLEIVVGNQSEDGTSQNIKSEYELKQITTCNNFMIPSAEGDEYFRGSDTLMTSVQNFTGTIERNIENRQTNFILNGLKVRLRSENISNKSLIPDPTGTFQISLEASFITGQMNMENLLGRQLHTDTAYFDGFFNLVCENEERCALKGQPFIDGSLILVGKGFFFEDENNPFIGEAQTARTFLIEQKSPIFIQLEATLVTKDN